MFYRQNFSRMKKKISFKVNGQSFSMELRGDEALLTVIRDYLNFTGTKYGCGIGECGACTVLIDNEPVRSCMTLSEDIEGKSIVTIEGLAQGGELHPIQKAFIEKDALQCGFCTPGMILTAHGLIEKNKNLSKEKIIEGMDANLCRCGAHVRIIEAIDMASREMNQKIKL